MKLSVHRIEKNGGQARFKILPVPIFKKLTVFSMIKIPQYFPLKSPKQPHYKSFSQQKKEEK